MSETDSVIRVRGLRKHYGSTTALGDPPVRWGWAGAGPACELHEAAASSRNDAAQTAESGRAATRCGGDMKPSCPIRDAYAAIRPGRSGPPRRWPGLPGLPRQRDAQRQAGCERHAYCPCAR